MSSYHVTLARRRRKMAPFLEHYEFLLPQKLPHPTPSFRNSHHTRTPCLALATGAAAPVPGSRLGYSFSSSKLLQQSELLHYLIPVEEIASPTQVSPANSSSQSSTVAERVPVGAPGSHDADCVPCAESSATQWPAASPTSLLLGDFAVNCPLFANGLSPTLLRAAFQ